MPAGESVIMTIPQVKFQPVKSKKLTMPRSYASETSSTSHYDYPPPIVLDIGCGVFKAGLAGEETPSCCFQNVVGLRKLRTEKAILKRNKKLHQKLLKRLGRLNHITQADNGDTRESTEDTTVNTKNEEEEEDRNEPKHSIPIVDEEIYLDEDFLVGDEALNERHSHQLFYPMENGSITDWEQFEFLIEYSLLDKLDVDPEESLLCITENPRMTKKEREKLAEVLFEFFGVAGLSFIPQPLLTLYSVGKTTGLVIDSGDCLSHTIPVYEGYIIEHAMNSLNLGGRDVTNYLQRILCHKGFRFTTSAEHHFVREIKEELCYVAGNYEKEKTVELSKLEKPYELPDGQLIKLDEELFECTELLFKPHLFGKECEGLAELVFKSFSSSPLDVRREFYSSIVLAGGNTLFPGFQNRIKFELENEEKSFRPFKVIADPMRQFSAWMGGSVIASLPTFEDVVVSFEDWEDYGPKSLYHKRKSFTMH